VSDESNFYFAYGSNMCVEQMTTRCSSARIESLGFVEEFHLVFNRRGTYRDGGVASIVPQNKRRVYGVIWELSDSDMGRLDAIEDPVAYERETVKVTELSDSTTLKCETYIAFPQGTFSPDQAYLEIIISAAKYHVFPTDYIFELERFRTRTRA